MEKTNILPEKANKNYEGILLSTEKKKNKSPKKVMIISEKNQERDIYIPKSFLFHLNIERPSDISK